MNNYTTFEQFKKICKSVRFDRRIQLTAQFSHTRSFGCDYYVYVCVDTLETFNPFTKKHEGRKYNSFQSSISADDAKRKAFDYIKKFNNPQRH